MGDPIRCLIPARGGSKRIRRKNLQTINGLPLVVNAYRTAQAAGLDPVVSTEDGEIAAVCEAAGIEWERRPAEWAADGFEIDDLVPVWRVQSGYEGALVVFQPSTVGVLPHNLRRFVDEIQDEAEAEHAVVRGKVSSEPSGIRFYPANVVEPPDPMFDGYPIDGLAFDVDWPADLAAAKQHTERRTIEFVTEGPGYGHKRRTEQLKAAFWDWNVLDAGYAYPPSVDDADVQVFDKLDTTRDEILAAKAHGPVVTFEDHGPGADEADLVINALYPQSTGANRRSGPDWAVIRPEFMLADHTPREQPDMVVLVTFGGTDPADLTSAVSKIVADNGWIPDVVEPQGRNHDAEYPMMGARMARADLIVTSCGRTLYEAAAVGTPALCMAANVKETTHGHLGTEYGNMYLGHHLEGLPKLGGYVDTLLGSYELRRQLSERGKRLSDWRGVERIRHAVEGLLL